MSARNKGADGGPPAKMVASVEEGSAAAIDPTLQLLAPSAYRAVMRHHASAVSVVATGVAGARSGLTATAVCSLSDDPPTVLVCVNRSASAHDVIAQSGCFSVNLLASDQQHLAEIFSGVAALAGEARFQGGSWGTMATGAPTLEGALATFDCTLSDHHRFATHSIFLGHVRAARASETAQPLIYLHGAFCGIQTAK